MKVAACPLLPHRKSRHHKTLVVVGAVQHASNPCKPGKSVVHAGCAHAAAVVCPVRAGSAPDRAEQTVYRAQQRCTLLDHTQPILQETGSA